VGKNESVYLDKVTTPCAIVRHSQEEENRQLEKLVLSSRSNTHPTVNL